ncbi:hypothetical protein [Streptomyces sp. CA-111067]|uniref:hypothetical protein n=1 Tax=Streptomyces sp. CA-111067 TaxID=3240046 RepID=UPI003D951DA6
MALFAPSVQLQINGTWTDVSSRVRSAIDVEYGIKASGGKVADPASCSMVLDNNDGALSIRNPLSPYYPYLGVNTPIRVGQAVIGAAPWLYVENGPLTAVLGNNASTPDASVLDIIGDLDLRADIELPVWGDGTGVDGLAGFSEILGKYDAAGTQISYRLSVTYTGNIQLAWSPDGTLASRLSQQSLSLSSNPPGTRMGVRATLDVNNGAGGYTIVFYTSTTPGTAGPWTQLGDPVIGTSPTSVFSGTAPLYVGDVPSTLTSPSPARKIFKAEVRSGIAGTIVANPDFTAQSVGATSFADTAPSPRTWTVTAAAITNVHRRFTGQVSEWPPTWDTGGFDVTVPIVAASALDRYGRSRTVLQSTLRRRIASYYGPSGPGTLVAYWPCEDGSDTTTAASPIPGIAPMTTSGVSFAADSTLPGSLPLPTLGTDASSSEGAVPFATPGEWDVELVYKMPEAATGKSAFFYINSTTGTWRIAVDATQIYVDVFDNTGTSVYSTTQLNTDFVGVWKRFIFQVKTSGSDSFYHMAWIELASGGRFVEDTVSGILPGRVTSVVQSHGGTLGQMSFGHIAVFNTYNLANDAMSGAATGYNLERTTKRIQRLASEGAIPMSIAGLVTNGAQMGPQLVDTVLNAIQDAVNAEEMVLYEAREFAGLRFRNIQSVYAQPSMLDLPYQSGNDAQMIVAPFPPVGDLQNVINDSTVAQVNGTSSRVQVEEGRLSVQEAPNGIGTGYAESLTENLASGLDTADHASWRTFVGTYDADRFPQINLRLEKNVSLVPDVARLDVTHRLRILAPLIDQMAPTTVDQMLLGYSETFDQFSWLWTGACQPHGPYGSIGSYDDTTSRYDAATCTLAEDLTTGETLCDVTHAYAADRWADSATYPDDFPFDVIIAGEVCTCTAVTGTTKNQTMTLTRHVNGIVKAQVTGESVSLAAPTYYGL